VLDSASGVPGADGPHRKVLMVSVDDLEAAGFNAWPALQQLFAGGWLIRFAEGYTKRANSANFLYPSTTPVEELVPWCEQLFAARELPPTFRLVDRVETSAMDRLLHERGYQTIDPSVVLHCPIEQLQLPCDASGNFRKLSLDEWMPVHAAASRAGGRVQVAHRRLLERITLPRVLGAVVVEGQPAACGMGVVDRGLFGLFDLVTDPGYRRRGYGSQLIAGLIGWARDYRTTTCYLQVTQQNHAARTLYEKLGFRQAYHYWYRLKSLDDNR
jgi:GNAT superfamily N-acetyltransferase